MSVVDCDINNVNNAQEYPALTMQDPRIFSVPRGTALGNVAADRGACAGRRNLERGQPVTVLLGWRGRGPRNVLVERADGSRTVRPFRGLRRIQ